MGRAGVPARTPRSRGWSTPATPGRRLTTPTRRPPSCSTPGSLGAGIRAAPISCSATVRCTSCRTVCRWPRCTPWLRSTAVRLSLRRDVQGPGAADDRLLADRWPPAPICRGRKLPYEMLIVATCDRGRGRRFWGRLLLVRWLGREEGPRRAHDGPEAVDRRGREAHAQGRPGTGRRY